MWNILKINHLTDSQASEAPLVAHPLEGVKPLFRNSFGCGQFRSSIRVFEELLLPSRMLRPWEGRGSNASLAAGMVSHPGGISPGSRRNDPPIYLDTPFFSDVQWVAFHRENPRIVARPKPIRFPAVRHGGLESCAGGCWVD
jgi:hypothetical protein